MEGGSLSERQLAPCNIGPCGSKEGPEAFAATGHWNDMDMLAIGTENSTLFSQPLTVNEARAQMALWTILKSPLLVSADLNDVARLHPFIDILSNEEVLAVSGDRLGKVGKRLGLTQSTSSIGECYVAETVDGFAAVLFNRWDRPALISLSFSDFLVGSAALLHVRDLWQHEDLGVYSAGFNATLLARDALILSLKRVAWDDTEPVVVWT
eukprot:TRINITY_DN23185_c0_g1_i3.p1 TRINITY_DN23185_c0_g1~~TRINITY_DN23185_c0_g1_i3.p1  ORF type:complete len:210 (+),score=39.51 TRINITY_DN23185_c0_g1_i3:144-773(+)